VRKFIPPFSAVTDNLLIGIASPVFTDNTRQDYRLSAERTKIASKHNSSRLFIFKMCLVMAGRRMKWNLTQQVVYTALEKEPTRVSNEHHASITPVSREQMSPTRQCKQLKLSKRKEICRMFFGGSFRLVPQCFNQLLAPRRLFCLPSSTNI